MTAEDFVGRINEYGHAVKLARYYAWESGRNEPPLDLIPSIARAAGIKRARDVMPIN